MQTVLLLILSNIFMTFAWYGHLKFQNVSLPLVIFLSWLIASLEYIFQVPANRIGHEYYGFTAPQLKIMQEVITLCVFAVFSILYLGEWPRWNDVLGFVLIGGAVFAVFVLNPRQSAPEPHSAPPAAEASRSV